MDAITLEGFLTAIAIGPVTVSPEQWLPQVFGSDPEDPMPEITSIKVFERVINLIMRFYNSLLMIFEIGPEKFSPTFYIREVEGKTYTIVDEWCSGFLQGLALAGDAWQPLLDEKPGILRSFQLFATPEGWAELDAAVDEAALQAEWSSKIEPTIHAIHAYWLPYREGSGKPPGFAPSQESGRKVEGGTQCALSLWERKEVQTLLWFRTYIALNPL